MLSSRNHSGQCGRLGLGKGVGPLRGEAVRPQDRVGHHHRVGRRGHPQDLGLGKGGGPLRGEAGRTQDSGGVGHHNRVGRGGHRVVVLGRGQVVFTVVTKPGLEVQHCHERRGGKR